MNRIVLVCLTLVLVLVNLSVLSGSEHANPVADPKAVVRIGEARFTVLTPELIRMEWSATHTFEDHASLVFLNRRLPVPYFTTTSEGEWSVITTERLKVQYRPQGVGFTNENLDITLTSLPSPVRWVPGMSDTANLRGTIRTLDGVRGATPLGDGLLSRDGWVVIDDTHRPLFDTSDWPWVMPRDSGSYVDLYFFGYGHNYKKALFDFTLVAGKIPIPPRFAFGLWWSRYWAYTDQEFKDLVEEFETYDVPLDVLVIDMDWHQTFNLRWGSGRKDQAGEEYGWTGYTWDTTFFPEPHTFLRWCDTQGLRTPLNLHPASGIQPHEAQYTAMARAMGIDPSTKKYVPFDITDKKFATNYLKNVIAPLEQQGVDFWWLDWQQWSKTKIPGVTPTWWLNYIFFTAMQRRELNRPLLFHRWGGLGNHRYQIGFSGDAISVWESLAFQPYFTATASNVGYGYWSHDIGGHMPGPVSPELYTRWIQFGTFSPIVRTHTTKNPKAERRIWGYPVDYFMAMRDMILLRYALIPYIYTMAREAYDTGISICRPLYYEHPELSESYSFTNEYMFGTSFLVAPIAQPVDSSSLLADEQIWIPPGDWYEWQSGTWMKGPATIQRAFAFDELPVYIRAGSVIPLQPKMKNSHAMVVNPLILLMVPGDSGHVHLYEDEANTLAYQRGEYGITEISQEWNDTRHTVTIPAVKGQYAGMPASRGYQLRIPGTIPPLSVSCNGQNIAEVEEGTRPGWRYDGEKSMTVVILPEFPTSTRVNVETTYPHTHHEMSRIVDEVPGLLHRLHTAMNMINNGWPADWSPDVLVRAAQTGNRVSLRPSTAEREYAELKRMLAQVSKEIRTLNVDSSIIHRALLHLQMSP